MENKQCTTCGIPVNEKAFADEISVREFGISGMCQSCQDDYFSDQDPADYFTSATDDWSLEHAGVAKR